MMLNETEDVENELIALYTFVDELKALVHQKDAIIAGFEDRVSSLTDSNDTKQAIIFELEESIR
jgi:tRNA(His) 5'-end guanylyltransferase